jgi:hypothetical protein
VAVLGPYLAIPRIPGYPIAGFLFVHVALLSSRVVPHARSRLANLLLLWPDTTYVATPSSDNAAVLLMRNASQAIRYVTFRAAAMSQCLLPGDASDGESMIPMQG